MASVLSQRLFVAALSGGACNLWTYLHEEAGCGPLVASCRGEKRAATDTGEVCVGFVAFRDRRGLWESHY